MKRSNALLVAALGSLTLSGAQSPTNRPSILSTFSPVAAKGPKNEIVPGYLLVKLLPSKAAALESASQSRQALRMPFELPGAVFQNRIEDSPWTMWTIPSTTDPRSAAASLRGQSGVIAAQPLNRVYPTWTDPNDPDYHYTETSEELIFMTDFEAEQESFRRLWHLTDTNAEAAWQVYPDKWYTASTKPANAPLISIIDTGCDMNHPDFANAGGTSTDIANGGQLDHARSAQFTFGRRKLDGTPEDIHGHGTHVAGLAVAAGNNGGLNGKGVIGTGYNARAFICRVFDDQNFSTDADAAAAIYYSVNKGAEIINMSLGTENFSQLFQDAVTYAWQKGVLVVAAGNEDGGGGGDLGPMYPAACSGTLAVTANGPNGVPANNTYSGYGMYVDIAAPGGDFIQTETAAIVQFVYSTACRGDNAAEQIAELYPPYTREYAYLAGTSMASPIVSGAAALFYGHKNLKRSKGWSNDRAYRAIEKSAASVVGPNNGGWEYRQGYGCLDMWSMLMEYNARGAQVGGAEGIVYYNGTAIQNVDVKAQRLGSSQVYSTTTNQHGYYRFEAVLPGTYKVWTAPFGATKTKRTTVQIGSDTTGFDFWCGTVTGDETAPTVVKFKARAMKPTLLSLDQWVYDTETGIDKVVVKIGTTPGGSDVKIPTEVVPKSNILQVAGFTATPGQTYYITGTYTNGNRQSVTATTSIVATS